MAVLRTQHALKSAAVTLVDTEATVIDIPRPLTLPAEGNTLDHVTRPSSRDEFRAGKAIVTLPAAFQAADVFCRLLRVVKAPNQANPDDTFQQPAPSGAASFQRAALFPTGASQTLGRDIINSGTDDIFPTNGTEFLSLIANLTLRENESLEITLQNSSGGDLGPDRIEVHYDFGLNPDIIGLRAIN